jgi:O-antigen/teichoic acid export membrane protein
VVIATPVCTLLFGPDFAEAGPVLAVGGIVLILMFQTIPLGRFAFAVDRKKLFNTVMFTATALTVPLDLVLVPWTHSRFGNGGIGAAVAFVFTEALILVVLVLRLAPQLASRTMAVRIGKCLLAGCALFAAAWFVRDRFLLIPITLGALAYGAAVVLLRIPDNRERQIAAKLWSRIRPRLPFAHPSSIANEAKP